MFITLTNARTGSPVYLNPQVIGDVQERNDPSYPNTRVAIIKTDGNFIPIKEDIEHVGRLIAGATTGLAGNNRARTQQGAQRPVEADDPGLQDR